MKVQKMEIDIKTTVKCEMLSNFAAKLQHNTINR